MFIKKLNNNYLCFLISFLYKNPKPKTKPKTKKMELEYDCNVIYDGYNDNYIDIFNNLCEDKSKIFVKFSDICECTNGDILFHHNINLNYT